MRTSVGNVLALSVAWSVSIACAADLPPALDRTVDFTRDVQPVLQKHCYTCHGPQKQKSDLRLDEPISEKNRGSSGEPVYVAGKSAESQIILRVAGVDEDEIMPPKGTPLSKEEVGVLRAWIDQGAKWPDGSEAEGPQKLTHWSFQPVKSVEPAEVKEQALREWCRNAIDLFIAAKLEEKGLRPSKEASRETLVRRAYLVLTGLPPTPEQRKAFLDDNRPDAFERLVDDLLASPRYGERWARHWLDVARFAETNGFETNTPRPTAYHYRDYVIRAFNDNTPYDRFVQEQMAGDALGEDAATGFLVGGAYDSVKSPDPVLTANQRANEVHDMINTTSTAFLGVTVACARCHNHKFDPVSQKDYYAFAAVFAGVRHGEREIRSEGDAEKERQIAELQKKIAAHRAELAKLESSPPAATGEQLAIAGRPRLREPVSSRLNEERFAPQKAKFVRFTINATNSAEPCVDELEVYSVASDAKPSTNVALASRGSKVTSSGDYVGNPKHKIEHLNDGRLSNNFSWISNTPGKGWVTVELAEPVSIERIVWGRDRTEAYKDRTATDYRFEVSEDGKQWKTVASSSDRLPLGTKVEKVAASRFAGLSDKQAKRARQLIDELKTWDSQLAEFSKRPRAYAGTFVQPGPTHRFFRGDPMEPREVVEPGAIESLGRSLELDSKTPERERRVALAKWITSKDNPLTARVMVNRLWLWHFGEGLVSTPSDFGKMGGTPTHPELLDWLAGEFMRSGWDIKHMQKLIVTSAAWRQESTPREEALKIDADSRLLWRFPPRRLEAEAIRDGLLAVSGSLNLQMGGPGWNAFKDNANYVRVYTPKEQWDKSDWRRMIYMYKVRVEHDATFGVFDCPDAGQPTAKRARSTTALQALNLLNSGFILEQANLFAARLEKEAPKDVAAQVRRAFLLCFGREATQEEVDASRSLVSEFGLKALCRALFNANEFLFVQ